MSFFRQFAAPALLTVFGIVSMLGTGLHLLPGCGHFHGPGHHCTLHDHAGHYHAEHAEQADCALGTSHSDCAICRFLALPRALTPPPAVVGCGRRLELLVDATGRQPENKTARPYGARAPPRLTLNA